MWQAEQGRPYFLANAGIAWLGSPAKIKNEERVTATLKTDVMSLTDRSNCLVFLGCILPPAQRRRGFSLHGRSRGGEPKMSRNSEGRSASPMSDLHLV